MNTLNWDDVENATQAAIVAASGYPSSRVVWAYQSKNAPPQDYIALTLGGEIPIGQDARKATTDLSRPRGMEILIQGLGQRELTLNVTVFTSANLGELAARRVAGKISGMLGLDGVRGIMTKVGITPFDPQPIQWVPDIPNATFRGRASLDVRCYVPLMGVYEYTTYIERVTGTATILVPGASGITAPFDSQLAPATLASIALAPSGFGIAHGASQQVTATGTYTDGTQGDLTASVAWSSDTPAVATVDTGATAGVVRGVAPGQATITASLGSISASTLVIVS